MSTSHERARDVSALPESEAEGGREADGVWVLSLAVISYWVSLKTPACHPGRQ